MIRAAVDPNPASGYGWSWPRCRWENPVMGWMFESGNPQRLAGDHHLLRSLHENYLSFLSGKDECGDDERWDGHGRLWVIMGGSGCSHLFGPCGLSMQASHDLHSEDWSFTSWDRTAGWPTRGEGWCRKKGTTFSENVTRKTRETDSTMMYKSWFAIPVFFGALFESFVEAIQQVDLVLWKSAEHWNACNGTPAPNAFLFEVFLVIRPCTGQNVK